MKFAIVNLGCKVNRVESDAAATTLIACGAMRAKVSEADLIVVNTCTVTGEAEKKTRKAVRQALRTNETARMIVTGCAAVIDAATYEAMDVRVEVVPKAQLQTYLEKQAVSNQPAPNQSAPNQPAPNQPAPNQHEAASLPVGSGFRTRVGVKVQDGCNNACTYCIVHVARGRAVSRPVHEVVGQCRDLARAGVSEIVLTGINLGSYRVQGQEGQQEVTLARLLQLLLEETDEFHEPGQLPCRFRLSSIEPRDVDDALIEVMATAQGRICRHVHLPLQSGSSKVLREMARPYDAAYYRAVVNRLYTALPTLALSTDIIAGFPGESDAEFEETLELARQCRFAKIHAFPYSKRAGTPAAERLDQVPSEVKAARAAALRELGIALRKENFAARRGTEEWALVEEGGRAMTESYYEVAAPPQAPIGSLVRVVL